MLTDSVNVLFAKRLILSLAAEPFIAACTDVKSAPIEPTVCVAENAVALVSNNKMPTT
jgi:hypothetical protein